MPFQEWLVFLYQGWVLRRKESLFVHPCRFPVAPEHTWHKTSSELCRMDLVPDHTGSTPCHAMPCHPHTEQAVTAAPTRTAGLLLSHQPWPCCYIADLSRQSLCMLPAAVLTQSSPSTAFHPWEVWSSQALAAGMLCGCPSLGRESKAGRARARAQAFLHPSASSRLFVSCHLCQTWPSYGAKAHLAKNQQTWTGGRRHDTAPRLQNSAPAPLCLVGLALSPPRKSQALHLTLKAPEAAQRTEVPTSMETLFFF